MCTQIVSYDKMILIGNGHTPGPRRASRCGYLWLAVSSHPLPGTLRRTVENDEVADPDLLRQLDPAILKDGASVPQSRPQAMPSGSEHVKRTRP
jgi:hypothetical protein